MLRLSLNLKCGDPMPLTTQIEQDRLLIVEGKDALNFFKAMARYCARSDVQVLDFGGVNELPSALSALVRTPGWNQVVSLGIIRDAEKDARSSKQSVDHAMNKAELPSSGNNPRVSIFILPDNERPGMLETLLCESFETDEVNNCIGEFFACCEDRANVKVGRIEKARAHAYLATREDPHVSVGVAAQKGYWDLSHQAFEQLRKFIEEL